MQRKVRLKKAVFATTAICGALTMFLSPAAAQDRAYDIPAGDLRAALNSYEAAAGVKVDVKGVDIAGRATQGFHGQGSARQVLDGLLAGTNLTSCAEAGGFAVISAAQDCPTTDKRQAAPEGTVDELVVTSTAVSHLSDRTRTGTRMDADPLTLPLSVDTVSEDLIQRQQAITLADAAKNVVGVTSGTEGSFTMRGFAANIMKNGNLGGDGRSNNLPILAISRVEVVKGPEAIIAGMTAGYGGVVNVITKTPPKAPEAQIAASVGSRGYYELGGDVGGPLDPNGIVSARLIASTQHSNETIAGYDGGAMNYVAPSVTLRAPNWGSELTLQYEYENLRNPPDAAVFGRPGDTSLSSDLPVSVLGPKDFHTDVRSRTFEATFEQKITDNWNLAVRYSDDRQHRDSTTGASFPLYFLFPYPDIATIALDGFTEANVKSGKFELRGAFNTGPLEHKLLLAYDRTTAEIAVQNQPVGFYLANVETGEVVDHTADLGFIFGVPGPSQGGGVKSTENGYLAMDQIIWNNWVVLAGYRHIQYDEATLTGQQADSIGADLPSLGIVYRATPTISLYANASKGFQSNQGVYTVNGDTVAPENAQQYEVGAKALLFGKRIAATLALYTIDQRNVAVPDPAHPWPLFICLGSNQLCYISVPGLRSKGVDLELSGQVLPHLQVRASYGYLDKSVDPAVASAVLYAHNQASIWATYNFGPTDLGWWVGGGLQYRSARNDTGSPADLANPGQVRFDVSAGYDAEAWSFVVGVKNVANTRLYTVESGAFGVGTVEQPREVMATVRYRFH